MRAHQSRALFLLTSLLSLSLVACFGGHGGGGGGGGGNGGGGGGGSPSPVFQITVTHTGNFQQGQQNATYTVTVTNVGTAPTSGNVQLTATIPSGETVVSGSGSGWSFPGGPVATRSDSLPAGQSWPSITVTVSVAANATSPQVFTVSVSGGGASNTATAQDSTTIVASVSLLFGRFAFLFSGFGPNGVAVTVAGSINVDQNGNVTGEEDFKDPIVVHTAQPVSGFCQNYPVAATGFCRLTAAGTTYQYDFVLRSNLLVARFFENPIDNTGITGSGILISQQVPTGNPLPTLPQWFDGLFNFGFSGTDAAGARMASTGVIFLDANGQITPQPGTLSQADVNDNATLIQPTPSTTQNVTGKFTPFPGPTVDANGRATMTMTICTVVSAGVCNTAPLQRVLNLAVYILAPVGSTTNNNPGRAFAIDITPTATSAQVLSGQFFLQDTSQPFSISGTNVFWTWGVVPGSPGPPATLPSSNTAVGTFTTSALLFDVNTAGKVNGGGGVASPLNGTVNSISVAGNGRTILSATVGVTAYTDVLYLDSANDGFLLGATVGGTPDTTVSFGDFTGQAPTSRFDNTRITGTYVVGTANPVLPGVPNGASPITLTPTGQSGSGATLTFSGNFVAAATNGTYSFVQVTGRGTALASQGQIFKNSNVVFYILTPNVIVGMGADQGVTNDAIGLIQF